MAESNSGEEEYESDEEQVRMMLRPRNKGSDDEEEEEDDVDDGEVHGDRDDYVDGVDGRKVDPVMSSDGDLGGVDDDDEDGDIEGGEEEEVVENEGGYDVVDEVEKGGDDDGMAVAVAVARSGGYEGEVLVKVDDADGRDEIVEGEEKKESEPYTVPTAGAFYMHDDRFKDSGRGGGRGGANRRTPGGRRLWESKDNQKWGHDKYEEMSVQETNYERERRSSRGRNVGRGKTRGGDRRQDVDRADRRQGADHRQGVHRVDRSQGMNRVSHGQNVDHMDRGHSVDRGQYVDRGHGADRKQYVERGHGVDRKQYVDRGQVVDHGLDRGRSTQNRSRDQGEKGNQNYPPKAVRGRSSRRYEPIVKNTSQTPPSQNRQFTRSSEPIFNASAERASNVQSNPAPAKKHGFASNLNPAALTFYPSSSFNQDVPMTHRREYGTNNKNPSSFPNEENFSSFNSGNVPRGKSVSRSNSQDTNYIDDSIRPIVGKLNNLQLPSSGSPVNANQYMQSKPKGRGSREQPSYQQRSSNNEVVRASQLTHANQKSSSRPSSSNSSETGEMESSSALNNSKNALVGKRKNQSSGLAPTFLYNGAAGGIGLTHGDHNFPGAATILQVMQFGGQHSGGMGVPTVGMALPGYVSQPGFGNSEMTWLPVLANAPGGALGAPYGSPYLTVDNAYYSCPPAQASSSSGSSKEIGSNNTTAALNSPPRRPELANEEFELHKPLRYSKMSFG